MYPAAESVRNCVLRWKRSRQTRKSVTYEKRKRDSTWCPANLGAGSCMSILTRISLFLIAPAGLCLAMVAWILGQWWFIDVQILASGNLAIVSVLRADWCLTHVPTGAAGFAWSAEIYPVHVRLKGALPSTAAMTMFTEKGRESMFEQIVSEGGPRTPVWLSLSIHGNFSALHILSAESWRRSSSLTGSLSASAQFSMPCCIAPTARGTIGLTGAIDHARLPTILQRAIV